MMNKDVLIQQIEECYGEIEELKHKEPMGQEHTSWRMKVLHLLRKNLGNKSQEFQIFEQIPRPMKAPIGLVGGVPGYVQSLQNDADKNTQAKYIGFLEYSGGFLLGIIEILKLEDDIEAVFQGDSQGADLAELIKITEDRFRTFFSEIPLNEYNVQEEYKKLLNVVFNKDKINKELQDIEFGGKKYRPDFGIGHLSLAIDIKFIDSKGDVSKTSEEISADITAFLSKYDKVYFVIYDLGFINDAKQYMEPTKNNNVFMSIIKQ